MKRISLHIAFCILLSWLAPIYTYGQDVPDSTSLGTIAIDSLSPAERRALEKEAIRMQKEKKAKEREERAALRKQDIRARRAALIAQEDSIRAAQSAVADSIAATEEPTIETPKKVSYMDSTDTLLMPDMEYFELDDSTMLAEGRILKSPPAPKKKNPAHAAFLSALVPGAGQIYGGTQWWMAPIFWGGMTGTICAVSWYNSYYNDFRDEYKYRITTGQVRNYEYFTNEALVDRMQQAEQQRDLWVLGTVGVYLLNVLHANVAVQLSEFKVQRKHREELERQEIMKTLTLSPVMMTPNMGSDLMSTPAIGLTLSF